MTWVVVPAAGRGQRFGGDVPKQFISLFGKSILEHTVHALFQHPGVEGAVIVTADGEFDTASVQIPEGRQLLAATGGASRAESVLAGLKQLPERVKQDDFVLVHDAARPNLRHDDLARLLERGRGDPVGAILASPVRDTLKRAGDDGGIDSTEPREQLWRALTPQLFRRMQLSRALIFALEKNIPVTDESMAMELQGARPLLIEGAEDNFKITTPADLSRFEYILSQRQLQP